MWPYNLRWYEVKEITDNSGRCEGDFTDVAKEMVLTYRAEDWPDHRKPPDIDLLLWGLQTAIGVLRDSPEVFERIVHKNNP